MEMSIEESMKVLQEVPNIMPITKESINVALETMRKYQKINNLVKFYENAGTIPTFVLKEIIEDGNDDNQRLQNAT